MPPSEPTPRLPPPQSQSMVPYPETTNLPIVYLPTTPIVTSDLVYIPTTSSLITTLPYTPTSTAPPSSSYAPRPTSAKYLPSSVHNTTTIAPAYSTTIVTVPYSTATVRVTGRYRAMNNGAEMAGSVSFAVLMLSACMLLAL